MLALGLVLVLASLVVLNLSGVLTQSRLDESVRDFETVLRMAKADAACSGKRIRLSFDADSGAMKVLWEPQPLSEPQSFVEYGACTWRERVSADAVRFTRCRLTGDSAAQPMPGELNLGQQKEDALQAITFFPDGSSDSAEVEIHSAVASDARVGIVALDGPTGMISSSILSEEDAEKL